MAVKEVAIAARDFGEGRAQQGDIIVIREPQAGIGVKEGRDFIWLIIDEADLPARNDLRGSTGKFKWNLPLVDLKGKYTALDITRASNKSEWYQEFMGTDAVTGIHTRNNIPPKVLSDIIVNKERR